MLGRIVEIAEPKRHLSLHRGFMKVSHGGETLGLVPLDDLLGVMVSGHGATHSSNLIAKFARLGISFCVTDTNFMPVAMMLPIEGNAVQSRRQRLQADIKQPVRKRLWAALVQGKINTQATVLERVSIPVEAQRLRRMSKQVRSGDPDNMEAQAARYYWLALFGDAFRRRRDQPGINGLLNYGYAILRSCMARAVLSAGLHPTLGLGHSNPTNSMCLVDDFMEPFRPYCDLAVHGLVMRGAKEVDKEAKQTLSALTTIDIPSPGGVTTLFTAMSRLALSYIQVVEGEAKKLTLPDFPDELSFSAIFA